MKKKIHCNIFWSWSHIGLTLEHKIPPFGHVIIQILWLRIYVGIVPYIDPEF